MISIRGWAKRLNAVEWQSVTMTTGIRYDVHSRPQEVTLLFSERERGDDGALPRKIELRLTADDARRVGDCIVDFLTKLEE